MNRTGIINNTIIKGVLLVLIFLSSYGTVIAQQREEAENLVKEGVALEDSGKSEQAILKYQQAISLDKNNLLALAEMSYSLLSLKNYDDAIKYCKLAIKTHPGETPLRMVYVTYGTAYDGLNKTGKSIDIYDEGLKIFPDYYYLYFNKGVSLWGMDKLDEALICFERSAALEPSHAGSHNAIGKMCMNQNKKIPALMAYGRLLVLEPESKRSDIALENIQKIMKSNIKASGDKDVTINISPDMLDTENKKQKLNNFSSVEFMLAMTSAVDYDSSMSDKPEVQKFLAKFNGVCSSLKSSEKNNYGFYWDYYVPYYIEMKDKDLTETFAYIVFSSSGDPGVTSWLDLHKTEVDNFYKWSEKFAWKIN